MANRKATFAKRQRETDLKDRARAKDARRSQRRNEVSDTKGPQIAWEEAVHAVSTNELPSLAMANQKRDAGSDEVPVTAAPPPEAPVIPTTSPGPATPRRAG